MSMTNEGKRDEKKINVILGCLLLMLLTSLPLFTDFLIAGTDLQYQLIRIEALKNGLLQYGLHLWAKPDWINPEGYSFAFFYGDTFLYIPALLRIIGVNVQMSYRILNIIINIVTVLTSYKAFKGIFKNEYTALLGAGLYSVSIYRLFLMYSEAELGEVLALAFLPLILYGVAVLLFEVDKEKQPQAFLWLALGLTGVFRSHILCFVITIVFLIFIMLMQIKKWKNISMWGQIGLTILVFVLLNGAYLYSMLEYILSGAVVNPVSGQTIQTNGVQIAQLFMFFYQAGASHDFGTNGVNNAVPVGVGFVLLVAALVFLYFVFIYGNEIEVKEKNAGWKIFWLGILGCLFSVISFPWDYILKINGITSSLVSMMQSPWHFLAMSLAAFATLGCITYEIVRKKYPEYYRIYGVSMFVLTCISGSYLAANMLYTYSFNRIKLDTDISYTDMADMTVNAVSADALWYILQIITIISLIFCIVLLGKKKKQENR